MKKRRIGLKVLIATIVLAVVVAVFVARKGIFAEQETVFQEGLQSDRVNIVYDTAGVPVPVPKGYVASSVTGERTVNEGFVIYEGEEEVTDSNKDTAQKTRNQWVWVPINDISEIYGTDSNGMKHGKLYNFNEKGRTELNWTESKGVMSITSDTSYREPDIITNSDADNRLPKYLIEQTSNELNTEMQRDFEKTILSIKKYGGFYIGRYETTGGNEQAKVVKMNTEGLTNNWYAMYEKSKELKGTNSNVRTSMIWGCLWDATLEWLVDTGEKTYSQVGVDSTSWGNSYKNTFTYTNTSGVTSTKSANSATQIPTGSTEYTRANNIYDMAGNYWEWTLEIIYSYDRTMRGNVFGSSVCAADSRDADVGPTGSASSRAALYIEL